MNNTTFASFKLGRHNYGQSTPLGELNLNMKPKTFQQLKTSNTFKYHHDQSNYGSFQPNNDRIAFNTNKKLVTNFKILKTGTQLISNQRQIKNQALDKSKSNPKINVKNYVSAKKGCTPVEKHNKENFPSRPPISAPTLLKNKSFIHSFNHQGKESYTFRPSHDNLIKPYQLAHDISMDSFDRRTQDISVSLESSNGQKDINSFLSSNRFEQSCTIQGSFRSAKIEKTLEFNRKNNKILNRGQLSMKMQQSARNLGQISTLSLMARQLRSSFQSQSDEINHKDLDKTKINKVLSQTGTINFSKKFHQYRNRKQIDKVFTIKDFDIIQEVGEGKYGKVYVAVHKKTGFLCALKSISKSKIRQQKIEEPLTRQIKIQMYLHHPNVVKLYGFFSDAQNIYLIMECCSQGHLLKLVKEKKILQQKQVIDIMSNIYQGVSFLHCNGVIHRDLKPQNIVIEHGVFKLCDFGWAAYAKGNMRTTFCGTPLYVCPEILKGVQYDMKADVWGLGVLTYELSYGRVPFPIWNQSDMIKIIKDPVYFPGWASVSQRMQTLIRSMLSKQAEKRPSLNQILCNPLLVQYNRQGLPNKKFDFFRLF